MTSDTGPSLMLHVYTMFATHQQYIKTGTFLLLAGVIALLLCLILLSIISTILVHSRTNKETHINCELLDCRMEEGCNPYDHTQIHQLRAADGGQGRSSGLSDNYAKPFLPGNGISLSRHCLTNSDGSLSQETDENRRRSPTNLDKSDTVSYHEVRDFVAGYTYRSDHVTTDRKEGIRESGAYEKMDFRTDIQSRMDKYIGDKEDEYIVVGDSINNKDV